MPVFKADTQLVLYAHVPKCGGSAVSWYLTERFGSLAFNDSQHTSQPVAARWSRTSPQHIDRVSLARLFPADFFDAVFTIVRHPVARLISAYHFQHDVEKSIPEQVGFSEWLVDIEERLAEDPFVFDNHVRPMTDIVPEEAQVFHMEHGLDALVGWFDTLTGRADGPRAIPKINQHGQYGGNGGQKVVPSDSDLGRIAAFYQADFSRFGYVPGSDMPIFPAPELTLEQITERDVALRSFNSPINKVRRKIGSRLGI